MRIPFTITSATPDDGKAILQISKAVGVFKPEEVGIVDELWQAFISQGEASGYYFIVCRQENKIAGYACYGPTPLTKGTFDFYWLATDPVMQGRGVGKALVAEVEKIVRQRGGRLLLIETSGSPEYIPTRRFYEGCDYHIEACIHDFYEPGDDLVMFSKRFEE